MSQYKWYAIQIQTGRENTIQKALEERIQRERQLNQEFADILQVVSPFKNITKISSSGKKTQIKQKLLPGYILIQMILNETTLFLINSVDGVVRLVGGKNSPQPLSEVEVDEIIGKTKTPKEIDLTEVPFTLNQSVKVIEGPFTDTVGVIQEILLDKGKVKTEIIIFGRPTYIDFYFSQVKPV